MDEHEFFTIGIPADSITRSNWWFLMSDKQKKQHLFIDSDLTLRQIRLLLRTYDEETFIKKKNN